MRLQLVQALTEISEDMADPKGAFLERLRCRNAARRLTSKNSEAELREVFISLSQLDDFPPANYLWNADQRETPIYSMLRERRAPVLRFKEVQIHRLSAKVTIEYGSLKRRNRTRETIQLRRDWRGIMIVEDRAIHTGS
ncbi:MAG: hypothetical protein ACPHNY_03815 [Akkermansiaceae bacterium]